MNFIKLLSCQSLLLLVVPANRRHHLPVRHLLDQLHRPSPKWWNLLKIYVTIILSKQHILYNAACNEQVINRAFVMNDRNVKCSWKIISFILMRIKCPRQTPIPMQMDCIHATKCSREAHQSVLFHNLHQVFTFKNSDPLFIKFFRNKCNEL